MCCKGLSLSKRDTCRGSRRTSLIPLRDSGFLLIAFIVLTVIVSNLKHVQLKSKSCVGSISSCFGMHVPACSHYQHQQSRRATVLALPVNFPRMGQGKTH